MKRLEKVMSTGLVILICMTLQFVFANCSRLWCVPYPNNFSEKIQAILEQNEKEYQAIIKQRALVPVNRSKLMVMPYDVELYYRAVIAYQSNQKLLIQVLGEPKEYVVAGYGQDIQRGDKESDLVRDVDGNIWLARKEPRLQEIQRFTFCGCAKILPPVEELSIIVLKEILKQDNYKGIQNIRYPITKIVTSFSDRQTNGERCSAFSLPL